MVRSALECAGRGRESRLLPSVRPRSSSHGERGLGPRWKATGSARSLRLPRPEELLKCSQCIASRNRTIARGERVSLASVPGTGNGEGGKFI
jgi:hypothetical protein